MGWVAWRCIPRLYDYGGRDGRMDLALRNDEAFEKLVWDGWMDECPGELRRVYADGEWSKNERNRVSGTILECSF